ncbi:MAG: efflux RND transporter periplasmic adaptor subunit [Phycisphaeraceae bacterium]
MTQHRERKKWTWRSGLLAAAVLVVLVATGATLSLQASGDEGVTDMPLSPVHRGSLVISVSEAGTIKAREQEVIKNEVEGRSTIIYLVDEGAHVEDGELLVELDSSQLENEKVSQQISVQNADAAHVRAKENLAVVQNQAKADVAQAKLDLQFAREDLTKYLDGDYPREKSEADRRIALAEQEYNLAQDQAKGARDLYEKKYISANELASDELALKRANLDYDLARADLDLLEQYTKKRQVTQLESDLEQAGLALERVERKAKADVIQAEADLRAKEVELARQQEQLAKTERQIANCRMEAPTSGMVVHATTGQGGWRGNDEPLAEGREVREREELIHLPRTDSMMAELKVHESAMEKVRVGQPVRIRVDALPGQSFQGRVTKIAPLPDSQSMWMNPDLKVYATEVVIDNARGMLRTGMSCEAEILIEHYRDTLYVPVVSVVRIDGQPTVYVLEDGRLVEREIELGLDNTSWVRVVSGLEEGEQVAMAPPLNRARREAEQAVQDEDETEEAVEMIEEAGDNAPAPAEPEAEEAGEAQAEPPAGAEERQRMQNMSQEERQKAIQRFRGSGGGGGGGPGGGGGGSRGGGQ